jgi:hypothetical protein
MYQRHRTTQSWVAISEPPKTRKQIEFHAITGITANKQILGKSVYFVRIYILTMASIIATVFWIFVPCSLVEIYRRFRVLITYNIRAMMEAVIT